MSGGYTPAFASIYDGSLYGKWPTAPVWASLLPLIDSHGEINLSYEAIAGRTGWPMELLKQGIAALMQPDPSSRSSAEEGRRLVLIDPNSHWGWRAVNVKKYRDKASGAKQVADGRNAEKVRRYKDRHRETPEDTGGHRETPPNTDETPTHTHTQTHTQTKTPEVNQRACAREPQPDIEKVFDHWRSTWNHRDAKLDDKRRARIQARLKNFTADKLCDAISGFRNSDWHTGRDPKGGGKIYDKIETLLREDSQVEEGLRLLRHPPRAPPKPESAMDRIHRLNGGSTHDDRVIEHEPDQPRAITSW